jgi:8-oxo-dGTP pyrophosphatase MutT (NUDIX family)
MIIRNTVKVIICNNNKILLNKSKRHDGSIFYDLPGGGQHSHETLIECALRECKEETGYLVSVEKLSALGEEFNYTLPTTNRFYHRIIYFYKAKIVEKIDDGYHYDRFQLNSCWIDINELNAIDLEPRVIKEKLFEVITKDDFIDLGCYYKK